jgi:hypothetical protein
MTYRVIQWGSGNVGSQVIAEISRRRDLKLIGLYVYDPAKAGRDAGQIAGVGRLGVRATADIDRILSMRADCVIHSPLSSLVYGDNPGEDLDVICALLASGKNVISSVGYMYPMTALSGRIDRIVVREISNFANYPSPEIILDTMGFGLKPAEFRRRSARYTGWLTGLFRESIQMVADGIGLGLDSIDARFNRGLAPRDFDVAAGRIPKGSVAAQRWEWAGKVRGRKRIIHETIWRVHDEMCDQWPRGSHSITVEGNPNMYLEFGESWNDNPGSTTSMHAVNAVPYVCEATTGIRTFLDLPWIVGRGSAS